MNISNRLIDIKNKVLLFLIIGFVCSCVKSPKLEPKQSINIVFFDSTYIDGKANEIGLQIDSLRQGLWVVSYPNGCIKSTCFYLNGKLNGPFKRYYQDGKIEFKGYLKDDEFVGIRYSYYPNGNVKDKGQFLDGKIDGIWEYYYENGKLNKKVEYKQGKEVNVILPSN